MILLKISWKLSQDIRKNFKKEILDYIRYYQIWLKIVIIQIKIGKIKLPEKMNIRKIRLLYWTILKPISCSSKPPFLISIKKKVKV